MDDPCCQYEADMQFKRDKFVDNEILNILRMRFEDCVAYESPDHEKCRPLYEYYLKAEDNWFSKCKLWLKVQAIDQYLLVTLSYVICVLYFLFSFQTAI